MLQSWKISFTSLERGKVRGFGGEQLHGLLFHLMQRFDPEFANTLHERSLKPFSLSGIKGKAGHRSGWTYLSNDEEYFAILHTLDDDMRAHIEGLAAILSSEETLCEIGALTIGGLSLKAITSSVSYAEILEGSFEKPPLFKTNLEFRAPASFRSQGIQQLFPEPGLVMDGLLRRWNHLGTVELDATRQDFEGAMKVSEYDLETYPVQFDKFPIIGFRGGLIYAIDQNLDAYHQGILRALMQFANYAGIGYKTTMGMGEVLTHCLDRRLSKRGTKLRV